MEKDDYPLEDIKSYRVEPVQDVMPSLESFTSYNFYLLGKGNVENTIDSLFAENNNLWICRYCETINLNDRKKCVSCGKGRS